MTLYWGSTMYVVSLPVLAGLLLVFILLTAAFLFVVWVLLHRGRGG